MLNVLIVGDGAVAVALDAALTRAGHAPLRWSRRRGGAVPSAEVVVLAVSDDAIAAVAAEVMRAQASPPVLVHCAGALRADEPFAGLTPRGAALLHPLRALAGRADDSDFAGTLFAVQGDDAGRKAALELVALVGGVPLVLDGDGLARYHAAAALVSNHAVGLVDAGVSLLASAGLDRATATRALAALLSSTARNLAELGLPAALTGPIARGDVAVVERHLAALAADPELAALYRATARRVTTVAAAKGRAPSEALDRIRALLGDA